MKHLQWLLATACMLAVCLSISAQSSKKVKSISPEKWVKSKVWSEGLKAKPHSSTNLAEFKAQYEANPEQWKAAFRWLASHDLTTIEKGKHPIEGTSLVVSVEDSKNEPLEKRTSESHRKHIDLQYVVKGTERFALLGLPSVSFHTSPGTMALLVVTCFWACAVAAPNKQATTNVILQKMFLMI